MIRANVISGHSSWKRVIKRPSEFLNRRLKILSRAPSFKNKNHEFSILLTNDKRMKDLNLKFRKKNKTTDVLSFPYYTPHETKTKFKFNKSIYLGDIIINLYKIDKRKKKFKKEFNKLWVHGLVHLLGYKHHKNKDFYKMIKIENKIIKQLKC